MEKTIDLKHRKFKEKDFVRISKQREAFDKGYTPNLSIEIFQVREVQLTYPTTYLLKDDIMKILKEVFIQESCRK